MARPSDASRKPGFLERHDNVYLYVPNLIGKHTRSPAGRSCCGRCPVLGAWRKSTGHVRTSLPPAGYARVAFALYAFAIALHDPAQCCLAYFFR